MLSIFVWWLLLSLGFVLVWATVGMMLDREEDEA